MRRMADLCEQRGKRYSMEMERLGDQQPLQSHQHRVMSNNTRSALLGVVAAAVIGGPLLVMMGLSLMASVGILILTSPLLILFSPLLIFAAFLLGDVMFMFALTFAMALAGLSTFSRMFRRVGGKQQGTTSMAAHGDATTVARRGFGNYQESNLESRMKERSSITESGQRVKEGEKKSGESVQHTAHVTSPPPSPPRDENENEKEKEKERDDKKKSLKTVADQAREKEKSPSHEDENKGSSATDEPKAKAKKSDKKGK